jgi:two-component system, LytTR family, response regulator
MLRAIIIDDEPSGILTLEIEIQKHCPGIKIIATTTSASQGIDIIEDYKPEIVFLDINMPEMNGFDLVKELNYRDFYLVFTTAHDEYAMQAIKHHAFDYLLKPIDRQELKKCVNEIILENTKTPIHTKNILSNLIGIYVKDGIIFIKQSEIIRLEASGSYTFFYLGDKTKHVASKSLKEYEAQLNPDIFYRCHNSHIVNLKKVVKFIHNEGLFVQMTDGSLADVSRKNKDLFLEQLKNIGE